MAWTRMVRVEWWGYSDSRCILKVDGTRDELMDCISEAQERCEEVLQAFKSAQLGKWNCPLSQEH